MKRSLLLGYQVLTGLSDFSTGVLLLVAPAFTLRWMRLSVAADALPFLSYLGAFVLSVGIACFHGAALALKVTTHPADRLRLETVWLLTGITRSCIAVFVVCKVLSHGLEAGWSTVAWTDGVFALFQFVGLARGWVRDVQP